MGHTRPPDDASVDLYWLPLGAGGHFVRLNGRVYEALVARIARRAPCDLYHSALEVRVPDGRFVIEMTPIRPSDGADRGVVAEGAVGARPAGRLRLFRYEVRRWRGGVIPDVAEAVESPRRLSGDLDRARRVLDLVPQVPTPVWGRDELHAGDMWELELADLVADRAMRPRRTGGLPARRRSRARLGRGARGRASPGRAPTSRAAPALT